MTQEHFHKVITEDTNLWDRVYSFDLIKVQLGKREVTGAISSIEMFLTSEANSFGAIIYHGLMGLSNASHLREETITPSKLHMPGNTNI